MKVVVGGGGGCSFADVVAGMDRLSRTQKRVLQTVLKPFLSFIEGKLKSSSPPSRPHDERARVVVVVVVVVVGEGAGWRVRGGGVWAAQAGVEPAAWRQRSAPVGSDGGERCRHRVPDPSPTTRPLVMAGRGRPGFCAKKIRGGGGVTPPPIA